MRIRFTSIGISYIVQAKRPALFCRQFQLVLHSYLCYLEVHPFLEFIVHIEPIFDQNQHL